VKTQKFRVRRVKKDSDGFILMFGPTYIFYSESIPGVVWQVEKALSCFGEYRETKGTQKWVKYLSGRALYWRNQNDGVLVTRA
jgi:hypothetical protein